MLCGSSPSSWAMVKTSGEYMPLENSVRISLSGKVVPGQRKRDLPRVNIAEYMNQAFSGYTVLRVIANPPLLVMNTGRI